MLGLSARLSQEVDEAVTAEARYWHGMAYGRVFAQEFRRARQGGCGPS